jgi:type IV pilus assembly protein PilY1
VQRSLSAELANYATWYSYHRTRIKVAKAGASEAFSRLAATRCAWVTTRSGTAAR